MIEDKLRDECGVAAVKILHGNDELPPRLVYEMLNSIQNRGDLSCGIATYREKDEGSIIRIEKRLGKVKEAFGEPGTNQFNEKMAYLAGPISIGHVRYATSDNLRVEDEERNRIRAQPYVQEHDKRFKNFAFGWNGNLANFEELMEEVGGEEENYHLKTKTDTELIKISLTRELFHLDRIPSIEDFVNMFSKISNKFDGAYSLSYLDGNGNLIIARDPHGFKPLAYSIDPSGFYAASESVALHKVTDGKVKDLMPGELMIANEKGIHGPFEFAKPRKKSLCVFELIYFANAPSVLDGVNVQKSREQMGAMLALKEDYDFNGALVAPIPETPRPMVNGYVKGLRERKIDVSAIEILIKSDSSRTFTTDDIDRRQQRIDHKFDISPGIVEGKVVVLLDDSIVRGTTTRSVIKSVKEEGGASEIHVRIGAPPNIYPCSYGIDMPTQAELVAATMQMEEIADYIGADSLRYNDLESILKAVGHEGFCDACFSGEYPTEWGQKNFELEKRG
ncbi:amidophosphoribosyltransferase [Candidatus Woesearchaeota archaeon]|nr:amidophosphoribosyltransferase [Candidatus Woesearchaeota archaeon]